MPPRWLPLPLLIGLMLQVAITAAAGLMLTWLFVSCAPAHPAEIPQAAAAWRRDLTRAAHQGMGLSAPVATLAAQVEQESAWRPAAVSPVGAAGLAQMMPATADWLADIYPDLGPTDIYNPGWSLRALISYDGWLMERVPGNAACERWAFALSGYNGGLGWVIRDRRLARAAGTDPDRWFGAVENHTDRAPAAERENRDYVRRILLQREPRYRSAGWGPGVCP